MKKVLKIVIIFLTTICIVIFSVIMYKEYSYKKNFFSNNKNEPYSQGIPLDQMDFGVYKKYFSRYWSGSEDNSIAKIVLPCNVDYYNKKDDPTPAITLKKGTVVYIFPSKYVYDEGYGLKTFPDYEHKWRYGYPFFETEKFYDYDEMMASGYYVKTKQIEKVAEAYGEAYKELIHHYYFSISEYLELITSYVDSILYRKGVFCAP